MEGADVPVLTDKVKEHIPEKARPKSAQNGKSAEAVKGPLKAENPTANQFLSKEARMKKVKEIVNSQPIMLLMKGNPDAPRCGFSSRVVKILQQIGKPFGSFDILSDEIVRQSAKVFLLNLCTYCDCAQILSSRSISYLNLSIFQVVNPTKVKIKHVKMFSLI